MFLILKFSALESINKILRIEKNKQQYDSCHNRMKINILDRVD